MQLNRVLGPGMVALLFVGLAASLCAQEKKEPAVPHKIVHYGDLKWTPIIKGCSIATVQGDYNVEGQPFVLRLQCADGTKVPAHWHPTDENVTVLKGTFLVAMGDTFDDSKLQPMNTGNYALIPREMRHFGRAKGDTVVQVHGIGPFKVNWVNASDVEPPEAPPAKAKP